MAIDRDPAALPPRRLRRAALPMPLLLLAAAACFQDPGPSLGTAPTSEEPSSTSGDPSSTSGDPSSTSDDPSSTSEDPSSTTEEEEPPPQVYTCPLDREGLVLCYEFEDGWEDAANGLLFDSTATGHHGTINLASRIPGHHGSAAAVTGGSTISAAHNSTIFGRLLDAFTVAAWIRPEAGIGSQRWILGRTGHIRLGLEPAGDDTYRARCTNPQAAGSPTATSELIAANTWGHVACIYNGTSLQLRVNGVQQAMINVEITTIGTNPLRIGNDGTPPLPNSAFVGAIDEIQLWEIALDRESLCEIAGIDPCPPEG